MLTSKDLDGIKEIVNRHQLAVEHMNMMPATDTSGNPTTLHRAIFEATGFKDSTRVNKLRAIVRERHRRGEMPGVTSLDLDAIFKAQDYNPQLP